MAMALPALQLITASIDFTRTVTEFAASDALTLVGKAISNWMAIEKVDDRQMVLFCELAKHKAHPNHAGWDVLRNLDTVGQSTFQRLKNAPIRLTAGATLAGLLGKDPDLAYIVTTTAVLAHYHTPEYAAEALLETLLDKGGHENGVKKEHYHWAAASLGSVISKIVNSVFLNTCNASTHYNIPGLPAALQSLGRKTLQPHLFAAVTRSVTSSEGNIVIRSEHFFADLTHWLYFHSHGIIKIVVQSTIVLEERRGTTERTVTLLIVPRDPNPTDAQVRITTQIKVSITSGSQILTSKTILQQDVDTPKDGISLLRKDFSELNDFIRGGSRGWLALLDDTIDWEIKYIASQILTWILGLSVSLWTERRFLRFDVNSLDGSNTKGSHVLHDLFACTPQLLHEEDRKQSPQDPVFKAQLNRAAIARDKSIGWEDREKNMDNLLTWFPPVAKMMRDYQKKCPCRECLNNKSLSKCGPGCKRDEAATRLLLLLARGLSNAMGGINASGCGNVLEQRNGMLKMLFSIIELHELDWDELFALTASILSGVSASGAFPTNEDESSSWVALQTGSFVVMARWLDLKEERHPNQVFALEVLEGVRIAGVAGEVGALRSEGTTINANHVNLDEDGDVLMDTKEILTLVQETESVQLEHQTAIFHIEKSCYRLLTLVQAGRFMRNVDATLALLGYLARLENRCKHRKESGQISRLSDERIVVVDFDRALGTWGFTSPRNVFQTTKLLTDPFKLNAILSASPEGCVVRNVDRWCFRCALIHLKANAAPVMIEEEINERDELKSRCLRIINVGTDRDQHGRSRSMKRYLEG